MGLDKMSVQHAVNLARDAFSLSSSIEAAVVSFDGFLRTNRDRTASRLIHRRAIQQLHEEASTLSVEQLKLFVAAIHWPVAPCMWWVGDEVALVEAIGRVNSAIGHREAGIDLHELTRQVAFCHFWFG